jgi:hypothetical protein
MTDRRRRNVPGRIAPAQTFCGATPFSPSGGSARSSEASDVQPARLLLPPRLIVPASTTVKRSLWVFRAPKLELLKD